MKPPVTSGVRLPKIDPNRMTPEQETAAERLIATPRGEVRGPFLAMLYSPEFLDRAQSLGEFLRYRCSIPERLREFAIIVTARFWRQGYEWHAHALFARKAGVTDETIAAIAADLRPANMAADENIVFDFCNSLHRNHAVLDETYAMATSLLGEAGVVELCGLCGYYAMLAMIMNVAQTTLPAQASVPFSPPEMSAR